MSRFKPRKPLNMHGAVGDKSAEELQITQKGIFVIWYSMSTKEKKSFWRQRDLEERLGIWYMLYPEDRILFVDSMNAVEREELWDGHVDHWEVSINAIPDEDLDDYKKRIKSTGRWAMWGILYRGSVHRMLCDSTSTDEEYEEHLETDFIKEVTADWRLYEQA